MPKRIMEKTENFNKIHTYIFLITFIIIIILGIYIVFLNSIITGIIYSIFIILSSFFLAYTGCTQCVFNKKSCRHIIPGILTRILPKKERIKYTKKNTIAVYITFLILIMIPQIHLWNNKELFVLYWIFVIINIIENIIISRSLRKHPLWEY